nr:hypothetical protein [Nanoarchaeum sp.]
MINLQFERAIKELSEVLDKNRITYAFIGSTNLALQGMDVIPRDLDLVVRLDDLRNIPSLFSVYNPSKVEELRPDPNDPAWASKLLEHPAYNVHFNIENVQVQILGEKDDGHYVSKLIYPKLTYVNLNSTNVPCFTLEAEAQAYEDTHRSNKAERVREFLRGSK